MTTKKSLPNYIYNDIIKIIINHLYNIKFQTSLYGKMSDHSLNHQELIDLCLVNKMFFSSVKNYINQFISVRNYEIFKSLFKESKNSQFSLLNSNILKVYVYKSFSEYISHVLQNNNNNNNSNDSISNNNNDFNNNNKKIYIFSSIESIPSYNTIINDNNIYNNSVKILVNMEIDKLSDLIVNNFTNDYLKELKKRYIFNNITFYCVDDNQERVDRIFKIIKYLNPKHVVYVPCFNHANVPVVSDISTIVQSPNLKSIEYDFAETFHISKINNDTTCLKALSLSLNLNDICRVLNGKPSKSPINVSKSVKEDWESMVSVLSNNKTIKKFSLCINSVLGLDSNFKKYEILEGSDSKLDFSVITNGIKSIFTSPFSNILTLEISFFNDFIGDKICLESLVENKTINTISLFYTKYKDIIDHVLPFNRTIRNLSIRDDYHSTMVLLKSLNSNKLVDLYSVSVYIIDNIEIEELYDYLLTQFTHHSIKEINFYLSLNKPLHFLINNSGTIVNIHIENP